MKRRTIILVSAVALVIVFALAAVIAIPRITARTVSIFKLDGNNVQMTKGEDKEFAAKEGMSLFDGYTVSTDIDSYAYLHLDLESLIKMDHISKVKVNKRSSKKLSVSVLSGALAIDAATQSNGQIIEIRANNAALVIRGTYIVVLVEENKATFAVLEGSGEVDGREAPFGSVTVVVDEEEGEKTYSVSQLTVEDDTSKFLLQAIGDNSATLINGGVLTEDDIAKAKRLLDKEQMTENGESEQADASVNVQDGYNTQPSIDSDDDSTAEPIISNGGGLYSMTKFSYANLSYEFEWTPNWVTNQGAAGGCILTFDLIGDFSKVSTMRIANWSTEMTSDIINSQDILIDMWKENWDGGSSDFGGRIDGNGFPVHPDILGQNVTVLLIALDADCNPVGYVLIPVAIPPSAG